MSELYNSDYDMSYIRSEKKRVKSRKGFLEKKIQALKKRRADLRKSKAETESEMDTYQSVPKPKLPFNFDLKNIDAEEQILKWTERFQTSQKTLEQVNSTVGKSINTVSALVEVMNALKGVQVAKREPVAPVSIDQDDPDIRYLRVAKSMLEAVRNPAVRQLVAETTKALKAKKV